MKSVKKLLQKAMVFTLAVSMMMGPSMTASAAGLSDLYKIENDWGQKIDDGDNTRTGTVSASQSYTSILDPSASPEGIYLDETELEFELPEDEAGQDLEVFIDWGGVKELKDAEQAWNDELLKHLKWRSSNTQIVTLRSDKPEYKDGKLVGTIKPGEKRKLNKIRVVPKSAGTATVTVELKSEKYNIDFSATANVTVVQYADTLEFNKAKWKEEAFSGGKLKLDDYVIGKDANGKIVPVSDKFTYVLDADKKVATLNAKDNTITLKTADTINNILVIGKYAQCYSGKLSIGLGTNATKVEFSVDLQKGDNYTNVKNKNKLEWFVNDGMEAVVTGTVTEAKTGSTKETGSSIKCTDMFTWSSAKPEIIEIVEFDSPKPKTTNAYKATLKAVSAGTTKIIATASTGKSFTLNATVTGDLTNIIIKPDRDTLYSGQTVDLNDWVTQVFGENGKANFMDAGLKWDFTDGTGENNTAKKVKGIAKIDANGVLVIKPDLKGVTEINVVAQNKKKTKTADPGKLIKSDSKDNKAHFGLTRVGITQIKISRGSESTFEPISVKWNEEKHKPDPQNPKTPDPEKVNVGQKRTYTLYAEGYIIKDDNTRGEFKKDLAEALGWTASGNKKIIVASRGDKGVGILKGIKVGNATITVSGSTFDPEKNKFNTIKATFKDAVKSPTKTLTLSVKNKDIAAKAGNQTIAITVKTDKGSSTNKNKEIGWQAWRIKDGKPTLLPENAISKGKLKYDFSSLKGERIKVTATTTDANVKASIYFDVVEPTLKTTAFLKDGEPINKNTIEVTAGALDPTLVSIGLDTINGAKVTYTVNKPGIAFILQDNTKSNKYGIKVYGLAKGTATVTATTSDGQKIRLTIKVKEPTGN